MTMITITQNTPVLVAIDITKARHEVLMSVVRVFGTNGGLN